MIAVHYSSLKNLVLVVVPKTLRKRTHLTASSPKVGFLETCSGDRAPAASFGFWPNGSRGDTMLLYRPQDDEEAV
jgi:hypothetical protein